MTHYCLCSIIGSGTEYRINGKVCCLLIENYHTVYILYMHIYMYTVRY